MIEDVVKTIESCFRGVLVNGSPSLPLPNDIDFYVPDENRSSLLAYLCGEGFVCISDDHKCQARRFIGGKCFFIDVAFGTGHLNLYFGRAFFTERLKEALIQDPTLESFLKRVYGLSSDERSISIVSDNYQCYRQYLLDGVYVGNTPFRPTLTLGLLIGMIRGNPIATARALTFSSLSDLVRAKAKSLMKRIGSGQIVAVLGPDGSGKSTVVTSLTSSLFAKQIYMGDWGFIFQPFYDFLYARHIFISRLVYPFFFVENWLRYARAYTMKLKGHTVLVDRYPGLNRHLRSDTIWLRLNDLMYAFFPKADRYIFISAPPEIIHDRRQELSLEEIRCSQVNLRKRLKSLPHAEIENTDLDSCLNEALSYVLNR